MASRLHALTRKDVPFVWDAVQESITPGVVRLIQAARLIAWEAPKAAERASVDDLRGQPLVLFEPEAGFMEKPALHINQSHPTCERFQQLEQFLPEHHDQFALDPLELGTTNVVTHSIDTGDHPPIRQHPRCIPFALHQKVEELVQDMPDQDIV